MRVLITGGAGRIGRVVATYLQQRGYDLRAIDTITPSEAIQGIEYALCDISDFAALRQQVQGCQAIVHLAALPSPRLAPAPEIFRVNAGGTFNVFEAAAAEGIQRIVQASSINAIGCAWNLSDFSPQYLPVDEHHPRSPDDVYSFSKQLVEDIGDYYWRRDGISSVALRFPWVQTHGQLHDPQFMATSEAKRELIDDLLSQSETERQQRLAQVRQQALAYRRGRPMEYSAQQAQNQNHRQDDPLWHIYTFDRFNLWAYIDVQDAAQAIEKSLAAAIEGSHALFANASNNWLNYDSQTLARLFFPEVTQRTRPLAGAETLVSIERARHLINFEPNYTVQGELHD